jgi:hypothetical protein
LEGIYRSEEYSKENTCRRKWQEDPVAYFFTYSPTLKMFLGIIFYPEDVPCHKP